MSDNACQTGFVRRIRRRLILPMVVAVGAGAVARKLISNRKAIMSRTAWLGGRLRGYGYRLSGRHPSYDVDDLTLADRVRSSLGSLEKRLDVPRVHVTVEDHVVLLHGEVGSDADADSIEGVVLGMPGVEGVESYLHVGLVAGDTRPSDGAVPHISSALASLHEAARSSGAGAHAPEAVRATLVTLADRLPLDARDHLRSHLPADVQHLLATPRRHGAVRQPRTGAELVAEVVTEGRALPSDRAEAIVEAVLGRLRLLVPDEAGDVAAVLPEDLRRLWLGAVPG